MSVIATVLNISAQEISTRLYAGSQAVLLSVIIGTGVGLVAKYWLDKRYIFNFAANNIHHEGRIFILYTLTGIMTTALFWSLEFGFDAAFKSKEMRYLGGVLGLAVGYMVKYQLDKRYVFNTESV